MSVKVCKCAYKYFTLLIISAINLYLKQMITSSITYKYTNSNESTNSTLSQNSKNFIKGNE